MVEIISEIEILHERETELNDETLIRLCAASEVQDQTVKRIAIRGHDTIALCRLGDDVFAVADMCTHGLASLSEGDIEDEQIFCPLHGGGFDIRTGKPTERPCIAPIKTWPVHENDGQLFIELG